MNAQRVRPVACLALAAGLGAAIASPEAGAKPKLPSRTIQCGEVLTESLRVANNLEDCPADGLVVGAPGITIDLGGHRIDGASGVDTGIDNRAGHDGVVIRNGIVSGFADGVALQDTSANTLTLLHLLENSQGIHLVASSDNTLQGNTATGNQIGIRLDSSSNSNTLATNTASANNIDGFYIEASSENLFASNLASANGSYGIEVFGASGNTFKGNTTGGNQTDGIILDSSSSDNVLKGNRASANDLNGIEVVGGSGNVLSGNSAHENGLNGVLSDTSALTLTRNKANGNGFQGGGAGDDVGLGISVPAGATASGNKALGNDDPNECEASDLGCHVP